MSIPRVTDNLGTVSQLDDRPNDTGGLTAAELKARFDKDSGTLKEYINDTLLPFLESADASAQLGIQTIPGFSAADVQTALEQIVQAMQDVTQGSVTDGSITLAKLAEDVLAAFDEKQPLTSTLEVLTNWQMLAQAAPGVAFPINFSGTDYRVSFGIMRNALNAMMLGNKSIATAQLKDAAVTSDKIAALAVLSTHIAQGAVTAQKIADGTITLAKVASELKYWEEAARTNTDTLGVYITAAWGHLWNYCWGTNQTFSMDGPEYARLDTFWESILYAAEDTVTVTLTGMPNIVDTETGNSYGTEHTFKIPKGKTLWMKKISTSVMLVGGSFARPTITSGTADPTGGSDGDIYIQYAE